jgi:hypothetical protein
MGSSIILLPIFQTCFVRGPLLKWTNRDSLEGQDLSSTIFNAAFHNPLSRKLRKLTHIDGCIILVQDKQRFWKFGR